MTNLFDGEAKGEVLQLRDQLDGNDPAIRKTAAKGVIALMRKGENVQVLFSSMLRCVKTTDIELKKLVYLYLVNYSSAEPEQAIMAVNTFIQDSQNENPLVRALAVRNMCRIRLESVAENMILPLKKCLSDTDPYVRKTSAFGVSKLYDVIPEAVENANLFTDLLNLLNDENPMVVSNTIAAVFEINDKRTTPIFTLNSKTVSPLLAATSQCSEWCQTILYDGLARYVPESTDDANFLIERLIPFLKHNNPAVVIGAFKCVFLFMDYTKKNPTELFSQIIPPFITLVSSAEPEIQYVVLRTISLFVLKYPKALSKEIRVFFCKYNDPSYVKMEKLDIIVTICAAQNAQLVLDELSEYCNEIDVAFVRKAIRCIGQIAIKIEAAARRCVDILVGLVSSKADYAVEEAIIVVCDILRKFPGTFESILSKVCGSIENLKEPRAKAAGIWILGEYCDLIDNVDVILDPFLDTFHDEQPSVQLQILSALIKVYIFKPEETKDQLQFVLNEATKDSNVPDVKNRALIYWRLLSAGNQDSRDVVIFGKQTVMHSGKQYEDSILNELIKNMGAVSGVLHVVPSDFVRRTRFVPEDEEQDDLLGEASANFRIWHQLRLNEQFVDVFMDYDRSKLYLRVVNKSPSPISQFAFAVNQNAIGLTILENPTFPESLDFGDIAEVEIPIKYDSALVGNFESSDLQIAIRTSMGNIFGTVRLPVEFSTLDSGNIGEAAFKEAYSNWVNSVQVKVSDLTIATDEQLAERRIFVVGQSGNKKYVSFALPGQTFVAEVYQEEHDMNATIKCANQTMLPIIQANTQFLFASK